MASYDYLIVGGGHDRGRRGPRDPRAGPEGLHRDHRRRPAPALQPSAADQGALEGRGAGQHLAQDRRGGGGAPPRPPRADGRRGEPAGRRRSRRDLRVPPALARDRRRAAPAPERARRGSSTSAPSTTTARRGSSRIRAPASSSSGGGFIGAEIAAALRMQGREVTMVVPGEGLGGARLPGRRCPASSWTTTASMACGCWWESRPSGWRGATAGSWCTRNARRPRSWRMP